MITLGYSDTDDIPLKLKELPSSDLLKVKLGSSRDLETVDRLAELDGRDLVLDANQAWATLDQALRVIDRVGIQRIAGVEQPFPKDRWDLHAELSSLNKVCVIGDESIQDIEDLRRARGTFSGVNLKLMKCGGVDLAMAMLEEARRIGLTVMLGSMSESSLGCGAMACLAAHADLVDLDGPWLIKNDPFQGLGMEQGKLVVPEGPGFGIDLRPGATLDWITLGA
jgi:L-alanine-DL-glutamate epimerase-like enolase superfamily enzyme